MVCLSRPYHFKFLKGRLSQISLGLFLNTLSQMSKSHSWYSESFRTFEARKALIFKIVIKLMTIMYDLFYSFIKQNGLFITQITTDIFNQRTF